MKKILLMLIAMLLALALVACGGDNGDPNDPNEPNEPNDPTLSDFVGITFLDKTVDYNGTQQEIKISGTLPAGASVSYVSNKGTDAGVYEATATVECEGYNKLTLKAKLTINKISYDMSSAKWSYTTPFTYDGASKSVTVTGLPDGVTVSAYSNNEKTDVGSYTASATLLYDAKNYNAPSIAECLWKINPAEITVPIELASDTVEYDTFVHSLAIVGNIPAGTSVSYTYNGEAVAGVTEVGTYTVVATISGANYVTKTISATLTIKSTEKLLFTVNHNGTVYFQNPLDDNKLYKVDGSSVVKVNNDQPEYFFSYEGTLYYYSTSLFSKVIKKINSAGTASTVLSVSGEYITSDGTYLYYAVNNTLFNTDKNGIYKIKLDGSEDVATRISSDKAAYLTVEGDYIYYSNLSSDKYLYRIATSGGTATCLHEEKVEYIIADSGVVYFDSTKTASAIYKYTVASGEVKKMTTDSGKYLTKIGNDIYYVNNDLLTSTIFGDGIYKISALASGSLPGQKIISATDNGYSSLAGDGTYLYYYKLNDKHLYRYNPDTEVETDLMASFIPPIETVTPVGETVIAEYKGEVYYTNPKDGILNGACLYKYNPVTGTRVKVIADDVAGCWFNGDYMYYSTCIATNYALFRMDMKTGESIKINSDRCENLIFEGNDIYYIKVNAAPSANRIMKMNALDLAAAPTEIYSDKNVSITGMYKNGNTFYFVYNPAVGFQKLYSYTIGASEGVDLGSRATHVVLMGDKLYFFGQSEKIYRCSLDGSGVETVATGVDVNDMYAHNGKLYYSSTKSGAVGLYCYDGVNNTRITTSVADGIVVIGGNVWFIQTAVNYAVDYPVHSGGGDCALYCYDGTSVTKK